jgi:hypothetical protein
LASVNTKVAGDAGGFKYVRIPKDLFDQIKAGKFDGYQVEVKLPGTPWQSVKLLSGESLATYTQAKTLLGEKVEQPEAKAEKPEEKKKAKKTRKGKKEKSKAAAAKENQEDESVADETVLWTVVQNEIYSDGSVKVRRMSGHEFQEVPEVKKPSSRDGSWQRKFGFDYSQEAPGHPDALIGLPGAGQSPGYDSEHGENWELPPGWVLNRGSSSGRMYLSGYDEQGVIIFMEFPQIRSGDPNNTYTKGDPSRLRAASR